MKGHKTFMVTICLSIVSVILHGWAITKLWTWFIVPTFKVVPIGIVPAIGISTLIAFLTVKLQADSAWEKEKKEMDQLAAGWDKDEHVWEDIIALGFIGITKPLVYVGSAWIIHLFM